MTAPDTTPVPQGAARPGSDPASVDLGPRVHSRLAWIAPLAYLGLAVLFMASYTRQNTWMRPFGIEGLTYAPPFPFRYRVLPTFLASSLARLGLGLANAYAVQGTLFVWGALLLYRRLLARFMHPDLARLLAPGLLYSLGWQYCVLNDLYFPFDLPGVFFFVTGWCWILERRWSLFYPTFVLATLNRETSLILTLIVAIVGYRRMPARALALHVGVQLTLWIGIKSILYSAFPAHGESLYMSTIEYNRDMLLGILGLTPRGLHNALKFALWGGGVWLTLPFIVRGQPEVIRRSLLAIIPFLAGLLLVARLYEMRVYGEVVCIVVTAPLVRVAGELTARRSTWDGTAPGAA